MADPDQLEGHLSERRERALRAVDDLMPSELAHLPVEGLIAKILPEYTLEPAVIAFDQAVVNPRFHDAQPWVDYEAPCTESVSWFGGGYGDHRAVNDGQYLVTKTYPAPNNRGPSKHEWQTEMEEILMRINALIRRHHEQLEPLLRDRITSRQQFVVAVHQQASDDGLAIRSWARAELSPIMPKWLTLEDLEFRATAGVPVPPLIAEIRNAAVRAIRNFGLALERSNPALAHQMLSLGEESIRELLVIALNLQWAGLVTGETFVRDGKTDVLLRWRNNHAFIGECKIWKGPKQLHEAIDQLLGYVPWRDQHAALIVFIKGAEGATVKEESAREVVRTHRGCRGAVPGKTDEFLFAGTDDKDRPIHLSLITVVIDDPEALRKRRK